MQHGSEREDPAAEKSRSAADSADPAPADPRAYWKLRSEGWTATTVSPLPTDDTFNRAMIEAAGLRVGETVIDLAAGTGDPSISIARELGPHGSVTACDLTPEMLRSAWARAEALGLGNWRAVVADMAALPFPEGLFDVATCRMGLMFPTDRLACASEALRVLRPGGRAVYLVWGTVEENPAFLMVRRGMSAYFGENLSIRRQRHALGAPGLLAAVLEMAGFAAVEERTVAYERIVEPGGDYFRRAVRRAFPDRYAALDDSGIAALIRAIEDACAELRDGAVFRIPMVARLAIGRKRG